MCTWGSVKKGVKSLFSWVAFSFEIRNFDYIWSKNESTPKLTKLGMVQVLQKIGPMVKTGGL